MNRRRALGTLGMGALAATADRGWMAGTRGPVGAMGTTVTAAATPRLRLGFIGLCAFIPVAPYYQVALLESTNVPDPAGDKFLAHDPQLLIAAGAVASYSAPGTSVKGSDLRLVTDIDTFQMWSLNGFDLPIVTGSASNILSASLTGTFPLKMVYNGSLQTGWPTAPFVKSIVNLQDGHLASGWPRVTMKGVEKCHWKCKGTSAETAADWDNIQDVPRLLSDVVEYYTTIPNQTTITLKPHTLGGPTEIDIKIKDGSDLEMWVINEPGPNGHTNYEMTHAWELQHARAFYQLFDGWPDSTPHAVPIANKATYPTSDPIFCPPADLTT